MAYVCRAVWGKLYAVDAYILSRSQRGFNKMMEDFLWSFQADGSHVPLSLKKRR